MAKKYLVINKATDKILMIADDEDSAYTFIKLCNLNFEDFSIEKVEMKYFGRSIVISINPKWVCRILNGDKTLEIRKLFPKDYIGWIFIYVTKDKPYLYYYRGVCRREYACSDKKISGTVNGKVVARFWCDKVEEIKQYPSQNAYDEWYSEYDTRSLTADELRKKSCLTYQELKAYLGYKIGYAIHITRLEVFDKPMELNEFRPYEYSLYCAWTNCNCLFHTKEECSKCKETHIQKAPQSWQYIED